MICLLVEFWEDRAFWTFAAWSCHHCRNLLSVTGPCLRQVEKERSVLASLKARSLLTQQCQVSHHETGQVTVCTAWRNQSLPHSTYYPNVAPPDHNLFCALLHFLSARHFESFEEVGEVWKQFFNSEPKDWNFTQIRMLAVRWQIIVNDDDLYFDE